MRCDAHTLQYAQICVMMMKRFVTENKKHCCQQFFSPSPFLPQKRTNLGMFVCNLCIAGTRREGLANIFAEEQRPCNLLFLSLFSRLLRWCFSSVPQIWMLAARFNFRRPTPPLKNTAPLSENCQIGSFANYTLELSRFFASAFPDI